MANKLYPPQIEGALPAFCLKYDPSNTIVTGAAITIPFTQSSAVSNSEIACFVLRLRTASTGSYLFSPIFTTNFNLGTKEVTFHLNSTEARQLNEGQFYKAQIAYCKKVSIDSYNNVIGSDIGYFSTVGIIKCTSLPKVYINNLTQQSVNFFQNEFIGTYDQTSCRDQTEKVYSYEFIVYDENDEIYYTTGEQLHQSAYDTEYDFSADRVLINDFIKHGVTYSIQYKVTTENELKLETPKYKLTNEFLASPNQIIEMIPKSNVENGYVTINFKGSLDMYKSQHYVLNDAALESERDNGEFIVDGLKKTAFYVLQSNLLSREEKISFLKQNSLYRAYDFNRYRDPGFVYVMTNNEPPNRTKYVVDEEIRYIYNEDYNNIIEDETLSDNEKNAALLTVPYYSRVATGRDIVKNLSYKYVEDNLIDLENYYVVQNVPVEALYYGAYVLSRASDADNYQTWEIIAQFRLESQTPSSYSFRDMTVEHGRKYKYGLQQSNIWGLVSSRIESIPYEVSFEDMFLYDGDKLLKIRFNPTVDSFKTKVLEQKTDTIGGRFPYITRNGATYYKEFPIGGLIACEMDEDQMFHKRIQGVAHRHSTNVKQDKYDENNNLIEKGDMPENGMRDWHMFSDENILLEREFKLAVLDWLNDGKPKLFKSPYEGNYIIRLMNNELKPVAELGRMLHTLTSQAYEIAECTYFNLVSYGFVNVTPPSDYIGQWRTYVLNDPDLIDSNGDITISFDAGLESFTIQDLMPGDIISLQFEGTNATEWEDIMIGITGSYTYTSSSDKNILKIKIHPFSEIDQTSNRNVSGTLNCYYQGARITAFDSIISQQLRSIPSQQYIGVNPWLYDIKYTNWGLQNNEGINSFNLSKAQHQELQGYNFRDFLDDSVVKIESGANVSYKINDDFVRYMYSFDPGELLDRINATLYKGKVYKIQLLEIEQAKFRLRELIPVYVVDNNLSASRWSGNKKFYGEKDIEAYETVSNYQYVATSPYGYPHPIEELTAYEMIDPYCIFEVFELDANHNWYPVQRTGGAYYDPYYRTWLREKYDPTVKINYTWKKVAWSRNGYTALRQAKAEAELAKAWERVYDPEAIYDYEVQIDTYDGSPSHYKYYYVNNIGHRVELNDHYNLYYKMADQYFSYGHDTGIFGEADAIYYVKEYDTDISLATIKEKDYKELKDVNSIHIGNGVIAELTFQIKVIDYYTEVRDKDVYEAKQYYLNRKQFYNSLMINYSNIRRADYYMTKSKALRNAYNLLLTGTGGFNYLKTQDKKIIRILLENNYEIEQLRLLKLYNVSLINEKLDLSAIEIIKKYKNDHKEDVDGTFGTSRLKVYKYESAGAIRYYALDTSEILQPIVDGGSNTNKTVYVQTTNTGTEIFYALDKNKVKTLYEAANSSSLIVYNNLSFTYGDYSSSTIQNLVQNNNILNSQGIYVYELEEIEDDAITTEYMLLDDIEAEDLKLTEEYIYMEEIPYSNNLETTFFEKRELVNLSKDNIDYEVEGVANKVADLSREVTEFNETISRLLDLIESETATYLQLYNDVNVLLDGYNQDVYTSWMYQELVKLLNAGQTWAAIRTQFVANEEEVSDSLDSAQNSMQIYLTACQNLYQLIQLNLPRITLYEQMKKDGTNDQELDAYLESRILEAKGQVIIGIVAMYQAIQNIKSITTGHSNFVTDVYTEEIINCFDNYNEVYGELCNLTDHTLSDYYGSQARTYINFLGTRAKSGINSLRTLILAEPTYTDPEEYAKITNYHEDMMFIANWVDTYGNAKSNTTITNSETGEKYIAYNVLPAREYTLNLSSFYTDDVIFNPDFIKYYTNYQCSLYNENKQVNTFFYRTTIRSATGIANQSLYTTFIFYPLATNRKDPLITTTGITSNYEYFNTLSLTQRQQVLEVSQKLNEITLNFIDRIRNSTMGDTTALASYIQNNYLAAEKPYNVAVLDARREEIVNPPRDEVTGLIIENAINFYNTKILMAEAALNMVAAVKLALSSDTRSFFKVANGKAKSLIYTNINVLSDVYTNPTTGEQTILNGYYKEYLLYLGVQQLNYYQTLLLQANKLLSLYEQQYANYFNKYNKYANQYSEYEAIFNSYLNTEEMDYYLNPGQKTMEDFRQEVKEAWWAFLSLLDYKYTKERERGMYV